MVVVVVVGMVCLWQICKQVRLLIAELCQEYNVTLPDEVYAIDGYLNSKVSDASHYL